MLRLGEGWSAAHLSREYGKGGAGELDRSAIAKIESDRRQIKAGEVEGVARVFGLTSADLLNPDGPTVFLSYAEQDGITGREVAGWRLSRNPWAGSSQEPDKLGFPGFGVADEQVIPGLHLGLDELVHRDGAVHDVRLGQAGPVLETLEIVSSLPDQCHSDAVNDRRCTRVSSHSAFLLSRASGIPCTEASHIIPRSVKGVREPRIRSE